MRIGYRKVESMENYITVSFWMLLVSICLRGFTMLFGSYPVKVEKTLGQEVFGAMLNIGFAVWAGTLIF